TVRESVRGEPTLVLHSGPARTAQPVQGKLAIDMPASARAEARVESRPDPRMDARVETMRPEPAPAAATPIGEPARRGFIGRLASHMRQASQTTGPVPAAATAPVAQASPQPTRISPADRLPTSRAAEEDLLDIPAFLRRQAN